MAKKHKARWTKWGPIVYSAVGDDRDILRMALHPVLDGAPQGDGLKLPCRAVWDFVGSDERWTTSCRGRDHIGGTINAGAITDAGPSLDAKLQPSSDEDVDGNAIAWLIEGESVPARESSKRPKRKGG